MPLLKHAKKKLRQDKKRTEKNRKMKELFKKLMKKAKVSKTAEAISLAFSSIDKAAKNNVIHKNKAARLKSTLVKTIDGKITPVPPKKPGKKKKSSSKNASKKK